MVKSTQDSSYGQCVYTPAVGSPTYHTPTYRTTRLNELFDTRPGKGVSCLHRKYSTSLSGAVTGLAGGKTFTCTGLPYAAAPFSSLASAPGVMFPDISSAQARAYKAMRPTMTTGLSLTNFLLELGDVKGLFKLWNRHESLMRNASSAHLNYSFGWKPFISDLKEMYNGILTFESRLKRLLTQQGQPQRSHYAEPFSMGTYDTGVYNISLSGDWKGYDRISVSSAVFHATMDYKFMMPGYSKNEMFVRAALDSLGLSLKPSQIWEAIPFSFIIDWFVSVGDMLEQFESDFLDPKVMISSVIYSTKLVFSFTRYAKYDVTSGNPFCSVASGTWSGYNRWAGLPITTALPDFELSQSLGRTLLGASLLHQRLK